MAKVPLIFTVNGAEAAEFVAADAVLADVLRDKLGLTGTRIGCGQGTCGACTVLLDGEPVLSCLTLAVRANGHAVTTIEGLATGGTLHALQRAFADGFATQCGFCTAGMILAAKALLDAVPLLDPDAQRRRRATRKALPARETPRVAAQGCPYRNRCPHVMPRCEAEMPPDYPVDGGGTAACFLFDRSTATTERTSDLGAPA